MSNKRTIYTRAHPEKKSKLRIYRSKIRWNLWTMILKHPMTHAQLGEKLGDSGLWQVRKWAYGFRRTMPIRLAFAVAREFKMDVNDLLAEEQMEQVEEIRGLASK